jgi:hypothetical protein
MNLSTNAVTVAATSPAPRTSTCCEPVLAHEGSSPADEARAAGKHAQRRNRYILAGVLLAIGLSFVVLREIILVTVGISELF